MFADLYELVMSWFVTKQYDSRKIPSIDIKDQVQVLISVTELSKAREEKLLTLGQKQPGHLRTLPSKVGIRKHKSY